MKPEIISVLFSVGTTLIALVGGVLFDRLNKRNQECRKENVELRIDVKTLADEVIRYSKVENAIIDELKSWTDDYKKTIRGVIYEKILGNKDARLMNSERAQRIKDKYI